MSHCFLTASCCHSCQATAEPPPLAGLYLISWLCASDRADWLLPLHRGALPCVNGYQLPAVTAARLVTLRTPRGLCQWLKIRILQRLPALRGGGTYAALLGGRCGRRVLICLRVAPQPLQIHDRAVDSLW